MRLLAWLLLTSPALMTAENAHLSAIRDLLVPMRKSHEPNFKIRGATPALTMVKHELIGWIESKLPEMRWEGGRWRPDPVVLQERLNDELDRAGLFCDSAQSVPCPDRGELGFLGRLVFDMKPLSVLIVRTGVGIDMCGEDQSAYAYQWTADQWHRFWESEQNDYREGKYFPQMFDEVAISPADGGQDADRNEHLILTLGSAPWCSSNWHDVYYRVWQTKSKQGLLLLLDGKEWAYVADSIRGSVDRDQVAFEYTVGSIPFDSSLRAVRHYVLSDGRLQRVDPVALNTGWFTLFWLTYDWPEIVAWTADDSRTKLKERHQTLRKSFESFSGPTLHCTKHADQWQVSANYGKDGDQQVYFLIRWRPPYRFTMLAAGEKPWADCTEEDPEADQSRDLFFRR